MKVLFASKMSPYELRNNNSLKRRRVNSVWHNTGSVFSLDRELWDLVCN